MANRNFEMTTPEETRAKLAKAAQLLEDGRVEEAQTELGALLQTSPDNRHAKRFLGFSYLQQDRSEEAIPIFEELLAGNTQDAVSSLDLAKALSQGGRLEQAEATLREVLGRVPTLSPGWFLLGDVLVEQHKFDEARWAFDHAAENDPFRIQIDQCKRSIQEGDPAKVERILRHVLELDPLHVEALAGMAMLAMGAEDWIETEKLFSLIQKRTRYWPTFLLGFAQFFLTTQRAASAQKTLKALVELQPDQPMAWNMLGTAHELLMQNHDAIAAFKQSLALQPNQPRTMISIGNIERVIGNRSASEEHLKQAAAFPAFCGEAYWALSNLKDYAFSDSEISAMKKALRQDRESIHNAAPMYFALAKAYEDRADFPLAFDLYSKGNAIQKKFSRFDRGTYADEIERMQKVFTKNLFSRFAGRNASAEAPIFIVGMPRTGSTLVEQIFASHSLVDTTMELPFVQQFVGEIMAREADIGPYPECVEIIDPADFARLGNRYVEMSRTYRDDAPRFTDKMPNNFVHIGLIMLMLPNARFVDVHRHPMDTCLSVFKQRFSVGQSFSYSLQDIAEYYQGYRRLMAHWNQVLPGKIFHCLYENLVMDSRTVIPQMLGFFGLPTEDACLTPHKSDRAIRTPSSEQVRQPISSGRIGYWRNFADQLEETRAILQQDIAEFESMLQG